MIRFLATRAITALITIWGASLLVFIAVQVSPGDFAQSYLGYQASDNPELLEQVRKKYGLDRPIIVQYWAWLGNALRGDLGISLQSRESVARELLNRGRVSMELALLATLFSVVMGIPVGLAAAIWRHRLVGVAMQATAMLGLSIPSFVLGTFLIFMVSNWSLGLPVSGYVPITDDLVRHFGSMLLPSLTLGAITMAVVARFTRSSVLDILSQDYVRTAHSKGLEARTVLVRHVLRNALIPTVTVVGINVGYLMGGTIIVEVLYSLPGMGRYVLRGLGSRDFPVVQGTILAACTIFVLASLAADVIYAYLDPRIRY
jgi:peptide/nickel transport system permease protein